MRKSQKDALHIRAFRSVFRQLKRIGDKCTEECFLEAICATSDDAFAAIKETGLIEEWVKRYSESGRRTACL